MGASICGAARPTPAATWDVASQIAPHGAGKKQRKENILLRLFTKNMRKFYARRAEFGIKRPAFTRGHGGDASPHIQRLSTNVRKSCAKRTMGVALPLPGRGGGISPHMKAFVGYFLKSSPQPLCPQGHHLGCNILCCRGRGASSPTKQNPRIQKPLRQFSKYSKLFFQRFLHLFYTRKGIVWD